MHVRLFISVLLLGALSACASNDIDAPSNNKVDQGFNNFNSNNDMPPDSSPDMGEEDMEDDMMVTGPGEFKIVEDRSRDTIVLRGTILTPSGPLDGEVVISPPIIACVAADCSDASGYDDSTIIDTDGVISPGLIDSHNHITYNFLPEWDAGGRTFGNRYEWADDPSYEEHILPFSKNRSRGTHFCPAARWGEMRSLINATTTVQGQSQSQNCIDGGARNADHEHLLQYDHMRTTIGSVRDINDADAQNYIASFTEAVEPTTRLAVHMAEGVSGSNIELEFGSFAGRDTRNNRHQGVSLLNQTSILIHSLAVTDTEIGEIRDNEAKVVWSPSSNFVLYGQTANIERMLELGITVGIGPDWTLSGEDNILGEMRYALDYANQTNLNISAQDIWEMATSQGSEVVGLSDYIGTIEVGKIADIAVFPKGNDPYQAVIDSRAEDVLLVFLGGTAVYGEAVARVPVGRDEFCEVADVCGRSKFVCMAEQDVPNAFLTMAETEQQLVDILEGTGFPADEQYGRGDDLLPLWSCE